MFGLLGSTSGVLAIGTCFRKLGHYSSVPSIPIRYNRVNEDLSPYQLRVPGKSG